MSGATTSNPTAVISPQYCSGEAVDLTIVRKMMTLSEGSFGISDVNGNIMFRVKGDMIMSLHDRRVLLDAHGHVIITFQQKLPSLSRRWQVFRGESRDENDLIFSVKKSSVLQLNTELDVFLASNTSELECDFKVEGSWFEKSCVVYARNSDKIIANMHRNYTFESMFFGKDSFGVTVYPNVDHAFITALIVILEEINEDRSDGWW